MSMKQSEINVISSVKLDEILGRNEGKEQGWEPEALDLDMDMLEDMKPADS